MGILDRFRLDGQVAIVTGAGPRHRRRDRASAFADAGADVVVSARSRRADRARPPRACARTGAARSRCPATCSSAAQLEQPGGRDAREFGRIDILVNNAGGWPPKPTLRDQREGVRGLLPLQRHHRVRDDAARGAADREDGGHGRRREHLVGGGPAALGGLRRLRHREGGALVPDEQLAQDFAPKVRVNAIAVGSIAHRRARHDPHDEIKNEMVSMTPMARLGAVEDIAACALYLASPAASYVTGEIYGVNGGLVALNFEMPRAFESA